MQRRPSVLVVDDDPDTRALVRMILAIEGYAVAEAPDGAAALDLARRQRADLILLDLWMPGLDGRAFARAYHRLPGPRSPLVVMTAAVDQLRDTPAPGAAAYLAKPFDVEQLLRVVGRHCPPVAAAG